MKNLRPRLTAFFFLALILAPAISPVWLRIRQQEVWHRMEEALEKEKGQTLELSATDLVWVREGRELRIGKELFDVRSLTRLPGGKIRVTGLFDEEEKRLHDHFNQSQKDQQSARTLQFFAFLYHTPHGSLTLDRPVRTIPVPATWVQASWTSAPVHIPVPPPWRS